MSEIEYLKRHRDERDGLYDGWVYSSGIDDDASWVDIDSYQQLKQRELELMARVECLIRHRDILADHMAEVKAIADGCNENTLADVVSHCVGEIQQLRYKAGKALQDTPQQSLAEHDAEVIIKAVDELLPSSDCKQGEYISSFHLVEYANQLRQQADSMHYFTGLAESVEVTSSSRHQAGEDD